ncbi:uncharacterized protein AMSG_01614 [Thecamonas trahens ATCC 50062]|uniref:Uncharacterized protein n=1 Tax=Thecamonas trahens ATCC 50062 TaxID=461836 RepID=A0A0L0DTH8_THETB|nr:hypothetical protein AMSG_01614 [Thecamonas trahens ATCC 50062]KNC54763.1 hypothetical protein AMSG_01614 [Thecamonas trahens ATCC 50062]|eukprot:XP_013761663.1 hypothetical protein AMSG_01614 [Thecamonas trahens ATCC 50062]
MLDVLPAELLHAIAYGVGVLGATDVLAMAMTCKALHGVLLGDRYSRAHAHALSGYNACVAHKLWDGARLAAASAMRGASAADGLRLWPASSIRPVVAAQASDDPAWTALVAHLARAGVCCKVERYMVWAYGCGDLELVSILGLVLAFGLEGELVQAVMAASPPWSQRMALPIAAHIGALHAVELILANTTHGAGGGSGRGDGWLFDLALLYACRSEAGDSAAVVARLLADERVDPTVQANAPLRDSCYHGREATVAILLDDPRVNPSVDSNVALCEAVERGQLGIVLLLLQHPAVDPTDLGHEALLLAISRGNMDVLDALLADSRVDSSTRGQLPLRLAAENGRMDAIARLLDAGALGHGQKAQAVRETVGHGDAADVLAAIELARSSSDES